MYYNDILEFDKRVFIDIYRSSKITFISVIILLFSLLTFIYKSNDFVIDFESPLYVKLSMLFTGALGIAITKKRALKDIQFWNVDARHISTFLVQMIDQKFMRQNLRRIEVPHVEPIPLNHEIGTADVRPNIILISQESTIPPALYDMPSEPDVAAFFKGDERERGLKVEVFGGQTIISIMSALTGLPSTIFGLYRVYAPRLWRDRIRVSLPFYLKQFSYRTMSFVTAESEWMNVGSFYKSIGMDELHEPSQFTKGAHLDLMHQRDSIIFDAVLAQIKKHMETQKDPLFCAVETLGNHAPFDKGIFDRDERVLASKAWFKTQMGGDKSSQIIEYMGRLRASVDDYNAFCKALSHNFPDQKFLIVHYGDHQPIWVNGFGATAKPKHFTTYFAVNYIGYEQPPKMGYDPDELPIFNLDLFVADRAGLPLNGYIEQKTWMLSHNAADDFGTRSTRFHAVISALRNEKLIREDN